MRESQVRVKVDCDYTAEPVEMDVVDEGFGE
jgi:hypothetical protein